MESIQKYHKLPLFFTITSFDIKNNESLKN